MNRSSDPQLVILAPVEESSSFVRGSCQGPAEVARELASIEPYDPDLDRGLGDELELEVVAIHPSELEMPRALDALEELVGAALDQGRFVITLGGEHTITIGPLKAAYARYGELGLFQIDAHGDLRESYEGRVLSHASVMRRAVELGIRLVGVGIRSKCEEEVDLVRSSATIRHISPRILRRSWDFLVNAIESLPERVYLTLDMDGFDPSEAPGVGTPEVGGLTWEETARIIDELATRRRIVAVDLVELAPSIERARTVRLAARALVRVLLWSRGSGPLPRRVEHVEDGGSA